MSAFRALPATPVISLSETRPRDVAQAFALCLRHLAPLLGEPAAYALLEQLILLYWLDARGWLGQGSNVFSVQLSRHYEADSADTSFYAAFVAPRLRLLDAAHLLGFETAALTVSNEACQFVFDTLFAPFHFAATADASDKLCVTPDLTHALLAQGWHEATTARRTTRPTALPANVAHWMCRSALIQFLSAQLES
ncbi:MAG: hypothetical protein HOP19_23440, partial [Acidobacteria bacterium]|nr:hypothetical protein [Acidobacteriota bacterium]